MRPPKVNPVVGASVRLPFYDWWEQYRIAKVEGLRDKVVLTLVSERAWIDAQAQVAEHIAGGA